MLADWQIPEFFPCDTTLTEFVLACLDHQGRKSDPAIHAFPLSTPTVITAYEHDSWQTLGDLRPERIGQDPPRDEGLRNPGTRYLHADYLLFAPPYGQLSLDATIHLGISMESVEAEDISVHLLTPKRPDQCLRRIESCIPFLEQTDQHNVYQRSWPRYRQGSGWPRSDAGLVYKRFVKKDRDDI